MPCEFRRDAGIERLGLVVGTLGTDRANELAAFVVERAIGLDVDRGTNAATGHIGATGLVDLQGADAIGRQLGEVERARTAVDVAERYLAGRAEGVRAGDGATVDGDQVEVRTEAAHRDLRAFAVAAIDRDAGDALQRLGQVGVRELADVLGAHRVHAADRVALDVHRLFEAVAHAGDLAWPRAWWAHFFAV